MNKRINFMFTIAAVAVMGGALFGSSFTSQMTGSTFDFSKSDSAALQKIHDMGGLELVMPAAFAEAGSCDSAEYADRNVVEFPLTGVSFRTESPRGDLAVFLVSDGTDKPYRVKVRAPSFANLQALEQMLRGAYLADAVLILGSIDLIMGEVDR